ncbi:MAG: lysoplasmalogenase [Ekhidna sp.]
MARIIIGLYILLSLANITADIIPSEELERYTKPLLMPMLLFYVYRQSIGKTTGRILLLCAALLFSWFGDVALMYQSSDMYFILGIGLFLTAQMFYIFVLRRSVFQKPEISLISIVPFLAYAGLLFYTLLPAGDFTIPIIIYGIVIMIMAISAFSRKNQTTNESFKLAFWGSVLFVLSDSILAINAFKIAIPFAGVLIMSTYCAAQLLLVQGILKHVE